MSVIFLYFYLFFYRYVHGKKAIKNTTKSADMQILKKKWWEAKQQLLGVFEISKSQLCGQRWGFKCASQLVELHCFPVIWFVPKHFIWGGSCCLGHPTNTTEPDFMCQPHALALIINSNMNFHPACVHTGLGLLCNGFCSYSSTSRWTKTLQAQTSCRFEWAVWHAAVL